MASPRDEVVQLLQRAVLHQDGAGLADGQLLGRFLERRDQGAAAALVRRHGPMVWGVCRRVLDNDHDAEDAFQATFLVLVRRAASINPREMVGNWLSGVARQAALKARATTARRRARESLMAAVPEPRPGPRDRPACLEAVLDQELSRLPAIYRAAIVLCDLEGRTRKEAAQQLGVPDGTLAARLARGRVMLGKRLARHGLALSGGALATVLAHQAASAGVPASVVSCTARSIHPGAAGATSARVAALAEGALKAMLRTKIRAAALALLAVAVLGMGLGGLLGAMQAAERAKAGASQPAAPGPEKKGEGPERRPAGNREIAGLVQGLSQADVAWDGQWLGIVAVLRSARARRLAAIGAPAVPELIRALSDERKFASAHAILTKIASGGQPAGDLVPCANGIVVHLPAEEPVSIDPAQRFELKRRWQKWYETSPRPRSLPR
jgi:RNA polymerase sigma factor (sigma-70 family)